MQVARVQATGEGSLEKYYETHKNCKNYNSLQFLWIS